MMRVGCIHPPSSLLLSSGRVVTPAQGPRLRPAEASAFSPVKSGRPDDMEWIGRLQEMPRNNVVWDQLVRRFHPRLLNFVRQILSSSGLGHDSEDVVNNVWAKVWSRISGCRGPHLAPWLYQIARNEAVNMIRAGQRSPVILDEGSMLSRIDAAGLLFDNTTPRLEVRMLLYCLLSLMKEDKLITASEAQALLAYYGMGEAIQDIKTSTTAAYRSRAMKALRTVLKT